MNRRVRALLLAATSASTVVVSVGPGASVDAQVPELQVCEADAGLRLGSENESVACLQVTLGLLGIYHSRITGVYDQVTSDAVRWFQLGNDSLPDDGIASAETLTALDIFSGETLPPPPPTCEASATISEGESGPDVECLQTTLDNLGMFVGEIDGQFGQETVDAVQRYQVNNPPLDADGLAGPRTLAAMGIWNGLSEIVVFTTYVPGATTIPGAPGTGTAAFGPWPAPMKPLPEYRLTAEGVPFYGNRRSCTIDQANVIAAQFAQDGADVDTQQWSVYVASREGGCDHTTVNYNMATQDDSHCTFQINVLSGTFGPTGELGRHGWTPESIKASLDACADAASDLWVYCGRGPWMPPYYCRPPWQGG